MRKLTPISRREFVHGTGAGLLLASGLSSGREAQAAARGMGSRRGCGSDSQRHPCLQPQATHPRALI